MSAARSFAACCSGMTCCNDVACGSPDVLDTGPLTCCCCQVLLTLSRRGEP